MTPARRDRILFHITTITTLEELDAFREGLRGQGEAGDADVMTAIRDREGVLFGRGFGKGKR